MEEKAKALKYLKKKFSKNASSLSQVLDYVVMLFSVSFISYMLLVFYFKKAALCLIVSLILGMLAALLRYIYRNKKFSSFIKKEMNELENQVIGEYILLLSPKKTKYVITKCLHFLGLNEIKWIKDAAIAKKNEKNVICFFNKDHPEHLLNASDILSYILKAKAKNISKILILTTCETDNSAKSFILRTKEDITVCPPKKLIEMLKRTGSCPSKELSIKKAAEILNAQEILAKDLIKGAFASSKHKAYILCGIISMIWSYFSDFNIIYPLVSLISFTMAGICYIKGIKANA